MPGSFTTCCRTARCAEQLDFLAELDTHEPVVVQWQLICQQTDCGTRTLFADDSTWPFCLIIVSGLSWSATVVEGSISFSQINHLSLKYHNKHKRASVLTLRRALDARENAKRPN